MKKIFIILLLLSIDVYASGGTLKQNSIIECNGIYYGNHGNPIHWHKAKKIKDKWVSDGEEVEIPNCYIKPVNTHEEVKFSKCVDGDTADFIIQGVEKKVRFLAIDTPEVNHPEKGSEPFGKDASNFTCNALKNAKKIVLEYDGNSEKEDKYGRILAFVYVDDELLEEKLIINGLAKVNYIYGDYAHVSLLKEKEEIAKRNEVGIWSNNLGDKSDDSTKEEMDYENMIYNFLINVFNWLYNFFTKTFA